MRACMEGYVAVSKNSLFDPLLARIFAVITGIWLVYLLRNMFMLNVYFLRSLLLAPGETIYICRRNSDNVYHSVDNVICDGTDDRAREEIWGKKRGGRRKGE